MKMKNIFIILWLIGIQFSLSAQTPAKMTIEAASPDPTMIVRGAEKEINYINPSEWENKTDFIALFTSNYNHVLQSASRSFVAVQIDDKMKVLKVINKAPQKGKKPAFNEELNLSIPTGGFILVASDNNYVQKDFKKFIAENFHEGDVVKLRLEGELITLKDLVSKAGNNTSSSIVLNNEPIYTVLKSQETISGTIVNFDSKKQYKVKVSSKSGPQFIACKKGKFSGKINLDAGVNYFDITLLENENPVSERSLVIYSKDKTPVQEEIVLWVSQFPNAKYLTSEEAIDSMIVQAKKAGFTAICIDMKGSEGFVSYRKNDLSKTPYITNIKDPNKRIIENGFDLLESTIKVTHAHGIKVLVSFNFFTEGNISTREYAVLNEHKDWEEIVQRPEDKGQLLRITESTIGQQAAAGKKIALAFVNPANKEVQDFQLLRVEEVLKNYDVDGIVLDRCRYDNLYADFSHVTRNAFADYLKQQNKKLENFPNDAFIINEEGNIVQGKYFVEWIAFRSDVIKKFTDRLRTLVDKYKQAKNPQLTMSAYVGSWYEVYYQNGVNWASTDFRYDDRLQFPESKIYTPQYYETSYLENLDFLMIGTYFRTEREINRYTTLGNILTNGKRPLYASIGLPDIKENELEDIFKSSLEKSDGMMIFDVCFIKNWDNFIKYMTGAINKKRK